MPYLSGVTNDIFISYASVDNEPDAQELRWVSRFRNDLEIALRRRLGRDVSIFFDQSDLRAYDELEELLRNARNSAIFLAVCSPAYCARDWTIEELKAFHATAQSAANSNRLVTIEVLPVEAAELPNELTNLKRTRFYVVDKDSRTPLPVTPASKELSQLYNERLQQLAHHLVLLLRELHDQPAPVSEPLPPPAVERDGKGQTRQPAPVVEIVGEPKAAVLLAQVTDDVYDERQKIAAYLEDYGVKVVPLGEYPESGSKFAKAVLGDLEQANLFVQLLGRVRSNKPEDLRLEGELAKSYAQFQYDAARRRSIPVLQWRHPDINPANVPQVNWDRQLLQGPDVRVMGLQDFMKEIRTAVTKLNEKRVDKTPAGDFIFINADRSDQDLAQTLLSGFKAEDRYAILPLNDESASANDVREDLEANLIDCKSLLLVYGKSSLAWVRAQIRYILKLQNRRQHPFQLKGILRGPPPAKPDPAAEAGFTLIDWQDGASPERVGEIVREFEL